MKKSPVFVIMGVSGCGKSTIGKLLADEFGCPFFDGDDYHPKENIEKMSSGSPLNDEDRKGWLSQLNILAKKHTENGAVIACSALKRSYRNCLSQELKNQMEFIYLEGTKGEILKRLQERKEHFMPPGLLDSQFAALEAPERAITVSIGQGPSAMVLEILERYNAKKKP